MRGTDRSVDALDRRRLLGLSAGCIGLALPSGLAHADPPLFLGVTTSTENSGLLAHLVERFEADHLLQVRAVTAGSGAVLNLAERGDVDVILVHSPDDEKAFVAAGYGVDRRPVMQNDYVIIGPHDDPAGVRQADSAVAALTAIAERQALFLSRGDESGTHRAELALWRRAGLDPLSQSSARGGIGWYRESGSGQGATLNIAANSGAYTLTDSATWATFGNRGQLEALFVDQEPGLRNIYSIIRVHPDRYPGLNAEGALMFADWLTSKAGRGAIQSFQVDGRPLFQPAGRLAG